jgi:uncharacterized protein (TIGR00369 family)
MFSPEHWTADDLRFVRGYEVYLPGPEPERLRRAAAVRAALATGHTRWWRRLRPAGPAPAPPPTAERNRAMGRMIDMVRQRLLTEGVRPPVGELLGFDVTRIDPGRAEVRFEAAARHHNPMGTVHGGILCDVADAAMGLAYASTLDSDESFTTLELKVNFLRPVRAGVLTATGRVVNGGRSVGLVACEVVDDRGRLVAHATSTCMTLRGDSAEGRRPGDFQHYSAPAAG